MRWGQITIIRKTDATQWAVTWLSKNAKGVVDLYFGLAKADGGLQWKTYEGRWLNRDNGYPCKPYEATIPNSSIDAWVAGDAYIPGRSI